MKKLISVLLVVLLSFSASTALAEDLPTEGMQFNNGLYFGMTFEDVADSGFPGVFVREEVGDVRKVYAVDDYLGYKTTWFLDFAENSLVRVMILFPTDKKTYKTLKSDYDKINKRLVSAYGKETYSNTHWNNGIPKNKQKPSIDAIKKGDLSLFTKWDRFLEENGTDIDHIVYTDGGLGYGGLVHFISFQNYKYNPITQAAKKESAALPAEKEYSLSSGEYDVGVHIAAGEYVVVPIKSANIFVYRGGSLKTSEYLSVSDEDEIGRLVLQEGDKIEISGGKLSFKPYK
jgi:hypothetical protein